MITCYAPTEDTEEEIKDEFDEQVDEEIGTTHQHDELMVVGNLNARVREDNSGRERPTGTQDFGCINNNIERLSNLCVEITSPDGNIVSQIDHVIINHK